MSDIFNNKAQHRYELAIDGHIAATYYKIDGNIITFVHTEVPSELGGKGIGSKLIRGALDQVRAGGQGDPAMPVREGVHRQERRLSGSAEMRSI
jgi:hypothetical protein